MKNGKTMRHKNSSFINKIKILLGPYKSIHTNKKIQEAEIQILDLNKKLIPLIERKKAIEKDIQALKLLIDSCEKERLCPPII